MSSSNAAEYADSLYSQIMDRCAAGTPFGWLNTYTGEMASDPDEFDAEDGNWTEASAFDLISDSLDIEYIVGSDRVVKDGRVFITIGGPNAWIDTEKRALIVTWMSEPEVRNLPAAYIDPISDALAEIWEMNA